VSGSFSKPTETEQRSKPSGAANLEQKRTASCLRLNFSEWIDDLHTRQQEAIRSCVEPSAVRALAVAEVASEMRQVWEDERLAYVLLDVETPTIH
jgi:hypothetical protein